MGIKYTDAYVDTIARAHLQPGEQVVGKTAGVFSPFWAMGIMFFMKNYLVIATNQRLLLAEHRRGLIYDRLESVKSIPWNDIALAKVGGLLKKSLQLKFAGQNLSLKLPGLLGPLSKSADGAKAVAATWNQSRALGAGNQLGQLPAHA